MPLFPSPGQPTAHIIHVEHSAALTLTTSIQTYLKHDTVTFNINGAGFFWHFTSDANLTGTVSKTATSTTLTGSSTLFTSELSVGQCIIVPGTANEYRIVASITSDTSLEVYGAFTNSASGQTAARFSGAIAIARVGVYQAWSSVLWNNDTTGNRANNIVKNNGEFGLDEVTNTNGNIANLQFGSIKTTTAPAATTATVLSHRVPMDVGDFFLQEAYHNAGADRVVQDSNSMSPGFEVAFIGYE